MTRARLLLVAGCAPALLLAAELRLGTPPPADGALEVGDAYNRRDRLVGKTILVRGTVTEVCQMAGCWVALGDKGSGRILRVKVTDGEIVFPKESVGRTAVVQGKLERFMLTREQAIARRKHEEEEQKTLPGIEQKPRKLERTVYQIAGTGALILD